MLPKRNILIIVGLLTLIILAIILIRIQSPKPQPTTLLTPSPSAVLTPRPSTKATTPEEGIPYQEVTSEEEQKINQDSHVGNLLNKLPFSGTYFRLEYDYSNLNFKLSINNNRQEEGYNEFDNFLKENQIENRSWLKNLVVVIEN